MYRVGNGFDVHKLINGKFIPYASLYKHIFHFHSKKYPSAIKKQCYLFNRTTNSAQCDATNT